MRNFPLLCLSVLCFALPVALCLAPTSLCAQPGVINVQPGQEPQATPQVDYTTEHLNAVVVSSLDGKPVARVLVTSPDRRMAAMTDSQGKFSFDYRRVAQPSAASFPIANYGDSYGYNSLFLQFRVTKPGYIANTVALSLPAVQPDTPEPTLQIKIVPAGIITGHVYPDSGDLPNNIQVQLRRKVIQNGVALWTQANGGQANNRGEFRFADLAPGDYKLMSTAWTSPDANRGPNSRPDSVPGLTRIFYPDATDLNSATIIHVGPSAAVSVNLVPHSTTFYRVIIPVAGSDTVQGANVMLIPDSLGLNLSFYPQDHAIEGYLPAGSYDARVTTYAPIQASGPSPSNGSNAPLRIIGISGQPKTSTAIVHIEVARGPVHTAPVTPMPGTEIPVNVHRDFTNPQSQQIAGRIATTVNSRRYPPVSLYLESVDSNQGSGPSMAPIGPDDPDDSFKLQNVTEGVYRVRVQGTIGGYVASATSGTTDLMHDPLTIPAAGSAFPIEVTLRDDFATVTGSIVTGAVPQAPQSPADTSPTYVMGISLSQPESNPLQSAITQHNQFWLGAVPPGRYLFVASHRQLFNELEYRNPDVLRDLTAKGTVVTLSGGQKTEIQIPLLPEEGN